MTMIDTVDAIRDWLEENVCSKLAFKKEPLTDAVSDANYKHELVHPQAWPIYQPSIEFVKQGYIPYSCPCVVVQPVNFKYFRNGGQEVTVRLQFLVWNPGTHVQDVYDPDLDAELMLDNKIGRFKQQNKYEQTLKENRFRIDDDGWRDALLFADTAYIEIKAADNIGGFTLANEDINATPYSEESVSQYFYPYHYMRMDIVLTRSADENEGNNIENFLKIADTLQKKFQSVIVADMNLQMS